MFIIASKRNPSLDEGAWQSYGGANFKVAHTSKPAFQRALARLQAPFRKDIEKGRMDPEEMRNIICTAISESLLTDWADVFDADKNPVPFNKANAKALLANDEGFREWVQEVAGDLSAHRTDEIKDKGND